MHGNHRCGEGDGSDLPSRTLGQGGQEMVPESPLIAVRHHEFAIAKGRHLTQKLVAGEGSFPVADMMAENQERGVHHRTQRIRRRSGEEILDPRQNTVVISENNVLFGAELAEERAPADPGGIGEVLHRRPVVALPHQ